MYLCMLSTFFLRRPSGNFTKILRAAFVPKFFCKKIAKQNYNKKKAAKNTFLQKSCS